MTFWPCWCAEFHGENIPVPKLVQLPRLPVTEAAELVKSCEARSSPPDHLTQLQCWLKAMVPSIGDEGSHRPLREIRPERNCRFDRSEALLKHQTHRTPPDEGCSQQLFLITPNKKICPPHKKKKHNVRISSNPASPSFNGVLP